MLFEMLYALAQRALAMYHKIVNKMILVTCLWSLNVTHASSDRSRYVHRPFRVQSPSNILNVFEEMVRNRIDLGRGGYETSLRYRSHVSSRSVTFVYPRCRKQP